MIGRVKRAIAAAAAVVVGSAALVACGAQEDEGEQAKKLFGYQVLSELRTTNAGTLEGACRVGYWLFWGQAASVLAPYPGNPAQYSGSDRCPPLQEGPPVCPCG